MKQATVLAFAVLCLGQTDAITMTKRHAHRNHHRADPAPADAPPAQTSPTKTPAAGLAKAPADSAPKAKSAVTSGNSSGNASVKAGPKERTTPTREHWPVPDYWVDGNGGGSEKQDAYWDIGNSTKHSVDFDHWAWKNPGIKNMNWDDREPTHHNNGIHNLHQHRPYSLH